MKYRISFARPAYPGAAGYWQVIHPELNVWAGPSATYATAAQAYRVAASMYRAR